MIYQTPSGNIFSFNTWVDAHKPSSTFDRKDYLGCLHGCMLAFTILDDADFTQLAVVDDGLLHELLHLAMGIDICTHTTMNDLRTLIIDLENRMLKGLDE